MTVTIAPPAPPVESSLSPDDFKAAFRHHPAGVAVITADAGRGPVMLTATSVSSVSAEPALLMFSLSAHAAQLGRLRLTALASRTNATLPGFRAS